MEANSFSRVIFESPAALRVWCLVAALALAPMPILHAYSIGFLIYLFDPSPPGWTRLTFTEARDFTLLGLPLAPIFLAWALPGAIRPGVPMRSIIVLCLLVAYNPLRHFFESHFYSDSIANAYSWSESPLLWAILRLDTPFC